MTLRSTIEVVTRLAEQGAIERYAIAGAIAPLQETQLDQMRQPQPPYPDISDVLARKAAGRKRNAARSFAEKLAAVDALKERVQPIIAGREQRRKSLADFDRRGRV